MIAKTASLRAAYLRGRIVPEDKRQRCRELLFGNYRIIYRVEDGTVQILTVIHGARDLLRLTKMPWDPND